MHILQIATNIPTNKRKHAHLLYRQQQIYQRTKERMHIYYINIHFFNKRNTTGATSVAGTAHLSVHLHFEWGLSCSIFCLQYFVDHCLFYFFFFQLYCLSFELRRLITSLVSPNWYRSFFVNIYSQYLKVASINHILCSNFCQ